MNAIKFTFDTAFDAPGAGPGTETRARRSYTPAEIDAIRAEAEAEGRHASEVQAAESLAAAMHQLADTAGHAARTLDGEVEAIRAEAAQLALAAAKALAGAALATTPEAEILDSLRTALHQAITEPRIYVKAAPDILQRVEAQAEDVAAQEGFDGRLQFVSDPALSGADCRIEWRGGGIERNLAEIESGLADIIARRFSSQTRE